MLSNCCHQLVQAHQSPHTTSPEAEPTHKKSLFQPELHSSLTPNERIVPDVNCLLEEWGQSQLSDTNTDGGAWPHTEPLTPGEVRGETPSQTLDECPHIHIREDIDC